MLGRCGAERQCGSRVCALNHYPTASPIDEVNHFHTSFKTLFTGFSLSQLVK